jgi:hypothetical protein
MTFQQALDRLRERPEVPLLVSPAQIWDPELDEALRGASTEELFPDRTLADPAMAAAALAGLHLWNDNFEAAHNLCQALPTPTGSYWHGLCHRREGYVGEGLTSNLGNSRYWFRQVGEHPIHPAVLRSALNVLDAAGHGFRWATEAAGQLRAQGAWNPATLSDWIGQAEAGTLSPQTIVHLEEIQWREIATLIDWCEQRALEG